MVFFSIYVTGFQVLNKIIDLANEFIIFPKSETEIQTCQDIWQQKHGIPFIVGALDCTHVRILKPDAFGDEYINRKGYPSINVQATCDANELFTSIDAQWPGSVQDSRIWRRSEIYNILKNERNVVVLGDMGYGISPWCLTPYKKPQGRSQQNFNKIHAKARVVIERCFGQIKKRFPIIGYLLRISQDKIPSVIVACAVLHNLAKTLNDEDIWYYDDFPTDVENINIQDDNDIDVAIQRRGQSFRDELANFLLN